MFITQALQKQALDKLFSLATEESFTVVYWDGTTKQHGTGSPKFVLILRTPEAFDRLKSDAEMGFAEGYVDGVIDLDGDVADFVALASLTLRRLAGSGDDFFRAHPMLARLLRPALAGASRQAGQRSHRKQQKDVVHHYDLSNDFFRLWLDESLTYSCAYFHSPTDTLEQAQRQKMTHSLRKLRLTPGEALLDVGCGWGALVREAAQSYGVQTLGITLSEEQRAAGCAEIEAHGLGDKADVRVAHYEALVRERRVFDKIVSIGMVEHVGKAHLPKFSQSVASLLRPGGLALLHQITSPIEGPISPWVEKYIFPGSYLPTLPELLRHLADNDLRVLDVEDLRPHYRLTLDQWTERFERCVPQVQEMYGEKFVRMWRVYLRAASAGFRVGTVALHQVLVSRGPSDAVPLTRDDLYAS